MKSIHRFLFLLVVAALTVACQEPEESTGSSTEGFFFKDAFAYNLTSNPVISIPVVRLGTSGDLTVNVSSSGSPEFNVPGQVTIKDGDRMGSLDVTYDKSRLTYNELYELVVNIQNYSSIYGYERASVTIEYPTSYFEFGAGHIMEDWWGEEEDKTMYVRDFSDNVYQCYLPDCWGHDSGPGYDVQDYVFFWNTKTNKVYVPFQFMGCSDWCIADRGAVACKFGGPGYKEGSAAWMKYIDEYYAAKGFVQPHYDPDLKAFYLSDSAACSPDTGEVVYGTAGRPDIFYLQ